MIKGIGASEGIAIGKAFVLPTWEWDIPESDINVTDLTNEFERLYAGIRTSKLEINDMKKEISEVIGEEESSIFDAHIAILDDPVFMREVQGIITRQYKAAEVAVKEAIDKFAEMFDLLDDDYMKERALDIKDVGNRLLKHLLGTPEVTLPDNTEPFILVAREISPSQLAHLNPAHVLGIVSMVGGRTSHSAIMARAMGIPLVIGIEGTQLAKPIATGDVLVIDGMSGALFVNPNETIIAQYEHRQQLWQRHREQLSKLIDIPTKTTDHIHLNLNLNISSINELSNGLNVGAHGVGLFRTEFLFLERDAAPSEDEQFQIYKQAIELLGQKPFMIRTLDVGGDKEVSYLSLREEENPFLGYRAIRLCLDQPTLFKAQLRAILRASHYGNVKVVYPFISSLEELKQANQLLEEAKQELRVQHIPFDEHIQVGIIIELPAAVMIADVLAAHVDFFSIGTNDLIQYTLAVDRMNEQISYLYDPFHPAVLRLIKMLVDSAHRAGIEVSVCGEMASDPLALPIWLGLGVHNLSMSGRAILTLKDTIIESNTADCKATFNHILTLSSGHEIYDVLREHFLRNKNKEGM